MAKQQKSAAAKATTKVTPIASPKVDPNAAKVYEAIERSIKETAGASADLNDISKDLSSTWSDMAKAITLINKNSDILGDNFDKVSDLTKQIYANIDDVGTKYFKQIDTADQLKKIVQEQLIIGKKLGKDQTEFHKNSEDITDLLEKRKQYEIEANKAFDGSNMSQIKLNKGLLEQVNKELEIANIKDQSLKILIKEGKETKERLKYEREVVFALDQANTLLGKANEHAEKLGFNFENATNTISSKLSKSFDFLEEIPFLSDVLGLDAVKEHIEKNVKDSLVKSMVAGKGAGASMFTGMIAGARTLMASLAPMLPLILAAAAALAVIATIEKAFEFDKELTKFSRDLDVSKDNALGLAIEADKIAGSMGVIGIHGKEILDTTIALREEFGVLGGPGSEKLVKNVTFLREKMGLTNEEALGLNSTATILGTTLEKLTAESMNMSEGLIGSRAMLKEMSKLPKSLVAGFKGTVKELEKAVIKGKLFGLTLEKTRSIGEGMLDIESSLEKEMTANVLTGKHMNLNAARQYALTGQYGKLQDEILEQAGSLDEFTSQGPLQQKAIADAMGMTVDEMTGMLSKAEELDKVYGMTGDRAEQLMKTAEANGKINLDNLKGDELRWAMAQNAAKDQEEATAKYDSAMKSLGEAFQKVALPIVEILGEALGYVGELITLITHGIEGFNEWYHSLTAVVDPITGATEKLKEGEGVMHSILNVALKIGGALLLWKVGKSAVSGLKGMAEGLKSMMPGASKTPTAPTTPDTSKMDKAKGKGSEGGLTSLAGGLKAMGQSGVGKGILNTALAGPALLFSLPSIPFLAFIGKVKLDKLEANFTGLGNGLKAMDGTLKGSLATGAFGIAGALALASIPFLLVFGKVKLDKLEDNFAGLGSGLGEMEGTLKGSLGVGAFGVAGLLAMASIPFLLVFGKVKLDQLTSNFTSLGTGLQSMSGTMSGTASLGAFGIAGALALASVPFLLVFGKVKFDQLITNFTSLSTGLQSMSGTLGGAAGLAAFALAGALAIPSLIFLGVFGKVTFGSLIPNFTGLAEGLMLMSPTLLGSAALAAFGLAAIIAIPSLIFLGGIALLGAVASAGLIALGTGLASLGAVAATGLPFIAVGLIAALGLAMIPFGIALAQSAPGIKAFAEVLGAMGPIIIATFEGIGTVIDKISGGIAMIITTIATSIKSLSDINPLTLIGVAGGIIAVGAAIAGFGAGAGAGGIMAGIGKFFDEDPVDKFNRFAKIDSGKLIEVASAIDKLGNAFKNFSASVSSIGDTSGITDTIDKVMELQDSITSSPIENIVDSVSSAVDSVFAKASEFVSSIMPEQIGTSMTPVQPSSDVQAVQTVAPAPSIIEKQPVVATTTTQAAAPAGQGSLTEVAGLLKQLIAATSQPVKINIGGRVIDEIEKQTTLRKTYNTKVDSGYGTNG